VGGIGEVFEAFLGSGMLDLLHCLANSRDKCVFSHALAIYPLK